MLLWLGWRLPRLRCLILNRLRLWLRLRSRQHRLFHTHHPLRSARLLRFNPLQILPRFLVLVVQLQTLHLTSHSHAHANETETRLRKLVKVIQAHSAVQPRCVVVPTELNARHEQLRGDGVLLRVHVHARHVVTHVLVRMEGKEQFSNLR